MGPYRTSDIENLNIADVLITKKWVHKGKNWNSYTIVFVGIAIINLCLALANVQKQHILICMLGLIYSIGKKLNCLKVI